MKKARTKMNNTTTKAIAIAAAALAATAAMPLKAELALVPAPQKLTELSAPAFAAKNLGEAKAAIETELAAANEAKAVEEHEGSKHAVYTLSCGEKLENEELGELGGVLCGNACTCLTDETDACCGADTGEKSCKSCT